MCSCSACLYAVARSCSLQCRVHYTHIYTRAIDLISFYIQYTCWALATFYCDCCNRIPFSCPVFYFILLYFLVFSSLTGRTSKLTLSQHRYILYCSLCSLCKMSDRRRRLKFLEMLLSKEFTESAIVVVLMLFSITLFGKLSCCWLTVTWSNFYIYLVGYLLLYYHSAATLKEEKITQQSKMAP